MLSDCKFDLKTRSYYTSIGLIKFQRTVVDSKVYLIYNGNYYKPVVTKLSQLRPDSLSFSELVSRGRAVCEGFETYSYLRMHSTVGFDYGLKADLVARARFVWIPPSFDSDVQPPEEQYTVEVRGQEYIKDPKMFWIEMNRMASQAAGVCKDVEDPVANDEWLKVLYPLAEGEIEPALDKRVDLDETTIFDDVEHIRLMEGEKKVEALRDCARAVTIVTQIPQDKTRVYVDMEGQDLLSPLSYVAAVRKSERTRKLTVETDADIGIYMSFERAYRIDACKTQIVVVIEPIFPSPIGYRSVIAYGGRIHTKGFKIRKYFTWEFELGMYPDLYVDFLKPDMVYAVNTPRAFAHIRAIWNMGYKNLACTREDHVEPNFIPHTLQSTELVGETISEGYTGYVDLMTGTTFRLRVAGLKGVESPWILNKGTCVITKHDIAGRARSLRLIRLDGTEVYAWLFLKSQMIKVIERIGRIERVRSVMVQVVD